MKYSKISFHPKLAAFLDAIINIVLILILPKITVGWYLLIWLGFRTIIWALLVRVVYYPKDVGRWRHFFSLVSFAAGMLCILIFMEWAWSWYIMSALFVIFPFVSFYLIPAQDSKLPFLFKPQRRWIFLMNIIGLGGIWTGLNAIISLQFFYNINSVVWLIIGSVLSTIMAIWWLLEYSIPFNKKIIIWTAALLVITLEFSWVIYLLPVGYYVSSLLLIWIWYSLWLIIRFHLSAEGVYWKKQTTFLILNLVTLFLFLGLVVRWK